MNSLLNSLATLAVACLLVVQAGFAAGSEFVFGFAGNGLTSAAQKTSVQLQSEGFAMNLAATGVAGAWLSESNGAPGLGIGSSATAIAGGEHEDFDAANGMAEGIEFSFDRAGVLTGLDFDGVKDENYEYFVLRTSGRTDTYFFDAFAGSSADPGLISVPGEVVFLNELAPPDDGILDLVIPFAAGQVITLTYGELTVGSPGNGARLQRIIVEPSTVPEPSTGLIALELLSASWFWKRRPRSSEVQ